MASAAGCADLIHQICEASLVSSSVSSVSFPDQALVVWKTLSDHPPPSAELSHIQRVWDLPVISTSYDLLLSSSRSVTDKARLLAVACKESDAWLRAGLKLDDHAVRTGVGLHIRLGTPLIRAVVASGIHGLSCRFSKGRHFRYSSVNDVIKRTLSSLGAPCHLEPSGISRVDGKRPDGLSMLPWKNGKALIWDFTCPDTLAPSYLTMSARDTGFVGDDAEKKKRLKYSNLLSSYIFIPITIETLGVFGTEANNFFRDIGRHLIDCTRDALARSHLIQKLGVCILNGNVLSISGTLLS